MRKFPRDRNRNGSIVIHVDWSEDRFAIYEKWCKRQNIPLQIGKNRVTVPDDFSEVLFYLRFSE